MRTQFNHDVYQLMISKDRNRQLTYMLGYIDEGHIKGHEQQHIRVYEL